MIQQKTPYNQGKGFPAVLCMAIYTQQMSKESLPEQYELHLVTLT